MNAGIAFASQPGPDGKPVATMHFGLGIATFVIVIPHEVKDVDELCLQIRKVAAQVRRERTGLVVAGDMPDGVASLRPTRQHERS